MRREMKVALGLSAGIHLALFLWFPFWLWPRYTVQSGPQSHDLTVIEFTLENAEAAPMNARRTSSLPSELGREIDRDHAESSDSPPLWCDSSHPPMPGATRAPASDSFANEPPLYPALARYMGYEGVVLLRVEVGGDGWCGDVEITKSSGFMILDQAAVDAVRRWRFRPATYLGAPVRVRVDVPIRFRLEDWERPVATGVPGEWDEGSAGPGSHTSGAVSGERGSG